uniref:transposase n=1 Tax=Streptomyces siderophoricus TaxID=2802281 RepID=UPI0035A889EA
MPVGHSVDPARWQPVFDDLMARVARRFARVEPRRRARAFVLGLLAELPRKNCWTIAKHAGDSSPAGRQHLLSRASWDADGVRHDTRDFAGRIENAQVAVYLVYSTPVGHAAIDRRLYIPRSWTPAPDRCRAAGIPDHTGFATKPALATEMITQALDAGVTASWVTATSSTAATPVAAMACGLLVPGTAMTAPANPTVTPTYEPSDTAAHVRGINAAPAEKVTATAANRVWSSSTTSASPCPGSRRRSAVPRREATTDRYSFRPG